MSKLLLLLTALLLVFLGFGTHIMPDNPMFWLAAGNDSYQITRVVMGVLLMALVFTNPPRHAWLRMLCGFAAVIAGVWVLNQTYYYHMGILDSLAFSGASVAMLITALERKITLDDFKPVYTDRAFTYSK